MIHEIEKPKIEESNFYETIHDAIKEGSHAEYLKNIVNEYEKYKKIFNRQKSFTDGLCVSSYLS